MFYILWALKNLYKNIKKSSGIFVFIVIITTALMLNFAFQYGTERQMQRTLRKYAGDISLKSRSTKYNLKKVYEYLKNSSYKKYIEFLVESFTTSKAELMSEDNFSYGRVKGISPGYFKWLGNSIEWIEGKPFSNKGGEAVVERSLALKLGIHKGSHVIVRYLTNKGAINTGLYKISGIFIGNKYEQENKLFVSLKNVQELALANNKISSIMIYVKDYKNEQLLQTIVNDIHKKFESIVNISVWLWDSDRIAFVNIFKFFHIFVKIFFGLITAVLLIILFFGIQNTFFILFHRRKNEISTLVTFGMPYLMIYRMVFWETIILFFSGIFTGVVFSLITGSLLSGISLAQITDEIVVVMGGPYLQFSFILSKIIMVGFFIFLVGLFSSVHALRKYFKIEVIQMVQGIQK